MHGVNTFNIYRMRNREGEKQIKKSAPVDIRHPLPGLSKKPVSGLRCLVGFATGQISSCL
jgi:hypothetical protein